MVGGIGANGALVFLHLPVLSAYCRHIFARLNNMHPTAGHVGSRLSPQFQRVLCLGHALAQM